MNQNPLLATAQQFVDATPHNKALGMRITALERGHVTLRVDSRPDLGGDPERGLYFPSVLLTLADAACGVACMSAINRLEPIATLDLRIDYLRPVSVEQPLLAHAHCHRYTDEVAFLHCDIRAETADEPAALVTASFMRTRRSGVPGIPRAKESPSPLAGEGQGRGGQQP